MSAADILSFVGKTRGDIVKEDPTKKKKTTVKKEKKMECSGCKNFPVFKSLDIENTCYSKALIETPETKTLAFILEPADFENMNRLQWKFIIASRLQSYNLLFLPYPKCYHNAWDDKLGTPLVYKFCANIFVKKCLLAYAVDLAIVTPGSKEVLKYAEETEIDFPGNWSGLFGIDVFCMKGLYSKEKKGFDDTSIKHASDRINKYFNKTLAWQRKHDFTKISNIEQLEKAFKEIKEQTKVALDVETSGLDVVVPEFRLKTIGIFWPKKAVCIAYEVEEGINLNYQQRVKELTQDLIEDTSIEKVCHNLKYEEKVFLVKFGMGLSFNNCKDTMFKSCLWDENRWSNSLKSLAGEYFDGYRDKPINFETATFEELWFYNCLDSYYTYMLDEITFDFDTLPESQREGTRYTYEEDMLPLCSEVAEMEVRGVQIDFDYITELEKTFKAEAAAILELIHTEFPQTIERDIDSPKELADVLFVILKYPSLRQTKTGHSVDANVLKDLRDKHGCKLAALFLDYKNRKTKLSTFVTPYLEKREKHRGDRVRTNYSQVKNYAAEKGEAKGTVTGRMCVHKDTLIQTSAGKMKIAEIEVAKGYRIKTHKDKWQRLLNKFYKGEEQMFQCVFYNSHWITCTAKHKFLAVVEDKAKWVTAEEAWIRRLELYTENGSLTMIASYESKGVQGVWDIEVEEDHSYLAHSVYNHNSSSGPNLQNIPRDKTVKRMFIATKSKTSIRVILQADLSQAELRIAASMANESNMLEIYRTDGDIHTKTALSLMDPAKRDILNALTGKEYDKELKPVRQAAKACFITGTELMTDVGWRKAEELVPRTKSGMVLNAEEKIRLFDDKDLNWVTHTYYKEVHYTFIEFELENGDKFEVTEAHDMVVFNSNGIFKKEAQDVLTTDSFITKDGWLEQIKHLSQKTYPLGREVFCLTVDNPKHEVLIKGNKSGKAYRIGQCNFGLLYGGSFFVLMNVARYQYGVDMTDDEAKRARQIFFQAYPGLLTWHNSQQEIAARQGYVISPMGRVRHLPGVFTYSVNSEEYGELMRQALNSPVQCTAADFLGEIWCDSMKVVRQNKFDAVPILTVHDSLALDCYDEDTARHVMKIMKEKEKERTDFHMKSWLKCPMKLDFELGTTWGDLKEFKA